MFCRTELYGCFGELYGSFHRQESHYVLSTGYNEVAQETGAVFAHRPIQHFNTTSTQSLTPTQHGQSLSVIVNQDDECELVSPLIGLTICNFSGARNDRLPE